ncbi:MAG TPA: DUF2508 family protein [Clostridiales bacterium]|jgi:hypothetical protein|nr:DUF2508 family protein [Clostridiales bacterium]
MPRKSKQMKLQQAALRRAAEELGGIRMSLAAAYSCFNNTSDPELAEAYIYEINALRARYDHALRVIKQSAGFF